MGVTRPAARAGTIAASTVTPTPSPMESAHVPGVNTSSPNSRCMNWVTIGPITANRVRAIAYPATSPSAVPMTPCSTDSATNMRWMVRRLAPIARNMPMSRRRSAMTVRKLFAMMNPAVARANTPNRLNANTLVSSEANIEALVDRPPTV